VGCGAATLLPTAGYCCVAVVVGCGAATLLSTAVVQPDRQTGTTVVALLLKSATIRVKSAVRRRVDAVFVIICCASVVVSVVVLRLVLCSFGRAALWHNIVLYICETDNYYYYALQYRNRA
jgi:hypothetical protein